MSKKDLTYFGEIEINSPKDRNEGKVSIDNRFIELDLNFYNSVPKHDWVKEYEDYILNFLQHKNNVEAAFMSDYEDGEETKEYVDFHFEELDASEIDKVLEGTDTSKSKEERFLSALKLVRVGFYPGEENYAVWDYTIGRDITDMLVVVNTDNKGTIQYVTWEN
ncbi:hypothetical protein HMPREF1018_01494 [Bacteroides fragilis]|uniref:DUF2004 domain-containing protein n=1 Tax=Bacteroides fragilis TaxID=817 RepID=UPI00021326E1|nr:DUF2004 domain-containing protein [Bacteroides fragilis]EGM96134.1 hypothetical protein HMPREF1018_01494 [Bacteroides fragilis]